MLTTTLPPPIRPPRPRPAARRRAVMLGLAAAASLSLLILSAFAIWARLEDLLTGMLALITLAVTGAGEPPTGPPSAFG